MIPSLNTLLGISFPNVALAIAGFVVGLVLGFEFSPNHRYKRKIKKLKKRLVSIHSVKKPVYFQSLDAFRKFDPEPMMRQKAIADKFEDLYRAIEQKKHEVDKIDKKFSRLSTRHVSSKLLQREKDDWEIARNQQMYIASCVQVVWGYISPKGRNKHVESKTYTPVQLELMVQNGEKIKKMLDCINHQKLVLLDLAEFVEVRQSTTKKSACGCYVVLTVPAGVEKKDVIREYQHIYIGHTMNSVWDQAMKCIKGTLSVGKDIYDAIHTENQLPFVCLIPCAKEDLLATKASIKDYFAAQKA